MFQTPEKLRDFCQLPSLPEVTQTTETALGRLREEQEQEQGQDKEIFDIANVSLRQYLDLKRCTEGDTLVVWFQGKPRYAWLARSRKTEKPSDDVPEPN
ncbi:hypothetical protein C7999DRAFT_27815 [Corynascus novoguineensis]|uniref:Uncharacterized protein n=1 Tax=Corynascus novoguineensis TaxID=1126955 RepID=A0AAN7D3S9_9PEZI|nr:hypothetical protein C7999DRAFT_27815 [Corynascus novoguineensis]